MIWYDMIWYDMIWYDMTWYIIIIIKIIVNHHDYYYYYYYYYYIYLILNYIISYYVKLYCIICMYIIHGAGQLRTSAAALRPLTTDPPKNLRRGPGWTRYGRSRGWTKQTQGSECKHLGIYVDISWYHVMGYTYIYNHSIYNYIYISW